MINRLIAILNEPYQEIEYDKADIPGAIVAGIFVAGFLIVFQPFGISSTDFPYKIPILAGFGVITTACILFIDFLIAPFVFGLFRNSTFRFKHWIVWAMFTVLFIATANFIYRGVLWHFSWELYLIVIMNTLAVGIFPIMGFGLYNRIRRLKDNSRTATAAAQIISKSEEASHRELKITDEKGDVAMVADSDSILFLRNSDNYVSIYLESEGAVKQELVRNSLKAISEQLSETELVRCHRGYIVNLKKVQDISGNAAGWRLRLNGIEEEVPVSRSYIPRLQEVLKHSA